MNPKNLTARRRLISCWRTAVMRGRDAGMTTAEYAVGTLAAVSFAALLIAVIKSGTVKAALTSIIQSALSTVS